MPALLFLRVATELGAIPATQYSVMGGGRFFPMVSREVSLIDHSTDLAAGCQMYPKIYSYTMLNFIYINHTYM